MKTVILALTFSLLVLSGMGMANNIKVSEVDNFNVVKLDEELCKKMATKYGTDTSSLSLDQIAQLQFCLSHTWGDHADTTPPTAPSGFETQSPSTGNTDTTPPQPPGNLTIVE